MCSAQVKTVIRASERKENKRFTYAFNNTPDLSFCNTELFNVEEIFLFLRKGYLF